MSQIEVDRGGFQSFFGYVSDDAGETFSQTFTATGSAITHLTFPVDLSRALVNDCRALGIPYRLSVLPCGHYSTGSAPFKYMDGAVLTRFLYSAL